MVGPVWNPTKSELGILFHSHSAFVGGHFIELYLSDWNKMKSQRYFVNLYLVSLSLYSEVSSFHSKLSSSSWSVLFLDFVSLRLLWMEVCVWSLYLCVGCWYIEKLLINICCFCILTHCWIYYLGIAYL